MGKGNKAQRASRRAGLAAVRAEIDRQKKAGTYGQGAGASAIQHPNRALAPGRVWLPHDGQGARTRRLRQMARKELKNLKKQATEEGTKAMFARAIEDLGPKRAKPREEGS